MCIFRGLFGLGDAEMDYGTPSRTHHFRPPLKLPHTAVKMQDGFEN